MIQIARDARVAAPPTAVWKVVSDTDRFHHWFPSADGMELVEGEGLGRRQRMSTTWGGRHAEIDQTVTAFDPPQRIAWRHDDERLNGRPAPRFARQTEFSVQLDPVKGGTRVSLRAELTPASFWRGVLIRLLTSRRVGAQMEEALQALPGQVISGDGESGPPGAG